VPDGLPQSTDVPIIPTGLKVKIPKTLSYPLGAQAISEALQGVPQIGSLLVDFWYMNRMQWKLPIPLQPYRVLSVSYWSASIKPAYRRFYIEAGQFDAGWRITVEPVPRSLRQSIQGKLLAEALPKMKTWLIASQDSEGRTGGHNLVLRFDETSNELKSEEHSSIGWTTARLGSRQD
jgi:hypothetical protein